MYKVSIDSLQIKIAVSSAQQIISALTPIFNGPFMNVMNSSYTTLCNILNYVFTESFVLTICVLLDR